jgi:hypothetical protein
VLFFAKVDLPLHFEIVVRESPMQTLLQDDPLLSQVADRPDAVQPESASGIRIVEVGVHRWSAHRSIAPGVGFTTSRVRDRRRQQSAGLLRQQARQGAIIGTPARRSDDITGCCGRDRWLLYRVES